MKNKKLLSWYKAKGYRYKNDETPGEGGKPPLIIFISV